MRKISYFSLGIHTYKFILKIPRFINLPIKGIHNEGIRSEQEILYEQYSTAEHVLIFIPIVRFNYRTPWLCVLGS